MRKPKEYNLSEDHFVGMIDRMRTQMDALWDLMDVTGESVASASEAVHKYRNREANAAVTLDQLIEDINCIIAVRNLLRDELFQGKGKETRIPHTTHDADGMASRIQKRKAWNKHPSTR